MELARYTQKISSQLINFFSVRPQDMEGATVLILWAAFGWLCLPAPTSPLPSYFLDTKCHKPRLTCSTVMLLMKPGPVTHPYQFPFAAPVITEIPTSHYGGETPLEKTTCFHQCGSYLFVCDQYETRTFCVKRLLLEEAAGGWRGTV